MKTIYSIVNFRRFLPFAGALVAMTLMVVMACNKENTQPDPGDPILWVTPSELHFLYEGGEQTITITITSNIAWAIDNLPSWVEVSKKFNTGDAVISITAPAFDIGELERSASFTVRTTEGLSQIVTISQGGLPLVTTMSPARNITDVTAELSGNWVFSGAVTITEAGVWVKRTGGADSTNYTLTAQPSTPGSFSVTATGLQHSANYTYHAYIKTSNGNYAPAKTVGTFTTAEVVTIHQFLGNIGAASITNNQNKAVPTNTYLYATVLSDRSKGNYEPARLVLTDVLDGTATSHDALILAFKAADVPSNTYTMGSRLKVHLQNSNLYRDNTGVLVDSIAVAAIELLSGSSTITPATVADHTELANYESVYVKIANTQLAQTMLTAPAWHRIPPLRFEVNGSENTYMVEVLSAAAFATAAPATGSGAMQGIVTKIGADEYAVRPRNETDVSQLTGSRFASQLAFNLTNATVSGVLKKNLPAAATVTIAYENSNGTSSQTIGIADVWGVSANYTGTPPMGNGTLPIALSGTPTQAGTANFTATVGATTNTVNFTADVLDLTFTQAVVTGDIAVGEALAATLTLSYINARDYTMPAISVKADNGTIVGSRAAGGTPEAAETGTLTILLSGVTPTNVGTMNFTITAGDHPVPVCTAVVNPKEFIITGMGFDGTLKINNPSAGSVTFAYKGADSGQEVVYNITLSGAGSAGLTSPLSGTYTIPAAGSGNINIPVIGTPTAEGLVTFTVTGLSAYGLPDGSSCTATVAGDVGGPFTLVWNDPTSMAGSNGPCDGAVKVDHVWGFDVGSSALAGLLASSCTATGFVPGGNWNTEEYAGGGIPCNNNPATGGSGYIVATITIPAGNTISLSSLKARVRMNNVGDNRTTYIVYRINGGAFVTSSVNDVRAAANNQATWEFNLSNDPNLQNLSGGAGETTLEIRIVPTAQTYVSGSGTSGAWTFSKNGGSQPLTITGTVD